MNLDPFTKKPIHRGEIWQASQCLAGEKAAQDAIIGMLESAGWTSTDHDKILRRADQTAIVCLVDDVRSCSEDYHNDLPYIFDRQTRVFTDNRVCCPTLWEITKLPNSFLGIYSYQPMDQTWEPDRDFAFNVNRIDHRRFKLMLELGWRIHLHKGYVNFNCQNRLAGQISNSADNFREFWQSLDQNTQAHYAASYRLLEPQMPVRNYDIDFDQVGTRAWINIIVESYSSDESIAVSEKIMRALVTPAPWCVSSGRYTVAYLESLGFDCLGDIINHNHYDRLKEIEDRTRVFIWFCLKTIEDLKKLDLEWLRQRCRAAAEHNQRVLADMRKRWPADFDQWLDHVRNTVS